jgi:outer membrane protein OmpA-like peptidoglycan-associated protein
MKLKALPFLLASTLCGLAVAQEANPTATHQWPQDQQQKQYPQPEMRDGVPVYKVQVVGRDIPALNYFHRSGTTKIGFQGTSLLPEAKGSAVVESRRGRLVIDAKFEGLRPANSFGVEYLTYVLWAITPEGRPSNLGEVLPDGSKGEINVTTPLQAFGLIVTAEPYYAVTMPSDLVVMQNFVLNDKTQGIVEQVNAHYSLLPRGAYTQTAGQHAVPRPITRNESWPLELYEAINAVQIAEASGADKYAPDTLARAQQSLQTAQDLSEHKSRKKELVTYARAAVQTAEDARIMTIRKKRAEDEEQAKQQAQNAQLATAQAQATAEQQAAERARAEARAAEAEVQAARAHQQTQQANDQTEQMRERLKAQLNQVLATRESARGLIVNMSDVLFDFNKYTLKPEAREKLAKVSGILLAYPGLNLQVEGYTDNIGSDDYNQKLSEQRAEAVRDYLVSQGVAQTSVTAMGYGKNDPIADNSTNEGRAQNRRVQMVVSGSSIGVQEQAPGASGDAALPANTNPRTVQNSGVSNPPQM